MAFSDEFDATDATDDGAGSELMSGAKFFADIRARQDKLFEIKAIMDDLGVAMGGELFGDGTRDGEDLVRKKLDVAGVIFPKKVKFLEPIADVPDVGDAREPSGWPCGEDDPGVGVDEVDFFATEDSPKGKDGDGEAE